ncbi:MAG TPA: AMP-binding protein [Anaerolineales bacterium]|nr:AMP-binding protein [Anaerolineales bacterium]
MTHQDGSFGSTISEAARRAADRAPDRVIFQKGATRMTFADLDRQASRLAQALTDQGFTRGSRAAVMMPTRAECFVALVGVARAGGVSEFLMPQYGPVELPRMLRAAPPGWLLYSAAHAAEADAIAAEHGPRMWEVDGPEWAALEGRAVGDHVEGSTPEDDAMILFTSGTTGEPKAIRRSHNSALTHGRLVNDYLGLTPEARVGMQLGQEALAQILCDGGCLILEDFTQPREWLATIERERITHIGGVTSLVQLWLGYPGLGDFDLSSVRLVAVGAMSAPPELHRQVRERFGLGLMQTYGSIEAGLLTVNEATEGERLSALGLPVRGKALRILGDDGAPASVGEIGELVAQPTGPDELGFMRGYHGEARSSWVNGWLHTGDLAYQDDAGYLYLVGRVYETINVAGHKVYAPEVERALARHPAVAEAAVVGQPDERRGEIVVAHVLLKPGRQVSIAELHGHCGAQLAAHKIPKRILIRDDLPRTATGKIDKKSLARQSELTGV